MFLEGCQELGREGEGAATRGGLGWADQDLAALVVLALDADVDGGVEEVDVAAGQAEQLAASQPAERSQQHQRPVAGRDGIGQGVDLADGRDAALLVLLDPGPPDGTRVHGEVAVLDGGREDRAQEAVRLGGRGASGAVDEEPGVPAAQADGRQLSERHLAQRREDVAGCSSPP